MSRKVRIAGAAILAALAGLSFWVFYAWSNQVLPQSALRIIRDLPPPESEQVILVFTPHPDDETIAAGGYIATAVKSGAEVWIALVTDGNRHGLERVRYAEFKKATSILGVTEGRLFFLGYPDHELKDQDPKELRARFREIIAATRPQIVVAPSPLDHHPDHKTTGLLVMEVAAGTGLILYQYLVHHELYPQPKGMHPELYLTPPVKMTRRRWRKFMLPESLEDQKHQAVLQYKTQLRNGRDPFLPGLLLGMIRKNELFMVKD